MKVNTVEQKLTSHSLEPTALPELQRFCTEQMHRMGASQVLTLNTELDIKFALEGEPWARS